MYPLASGIISYAPKKRTNSKLKSSPLNSSWPKSASHLSRKLKELVTTLREIGIEIEWSTDPTTKTRTIRIRKVPPMSYMLSLNDLNILNTAKTLSPEEFNRLEYSGRFLIILRSGDRLPLL